MKIPLPNTARFSIGGDPEGFLLDKKGYIAPLHHLEKDFPVYFNTPVWRRDGCAIEWNPHPERCRESFLYGIRGTLNKLNDFASRREGHFVLRAKARTLTKYLADAPDDMKQGGCDPDYDAYSGMLKTPRSYRTNARYAGGHVHFGVHESNSERAGYVKLPEDELVERYAGVITLLDQYVGIPLVAIGGSQQATGEAERRRYYGQAGSFRVQPHGFEYRVPSSYLYSSPVLLSGMLGMARIVVNSYFLNTHEQLVLNTEKSQKASKQLRLLDEITVRHIIDTHDYLAAQAWCMEVLFPSIGYVQNVSNSSSKDFHIIATALAALTYGSMQEHFLSTNLATNWIDFYGPAWALAMRNGWGWYKYVQEFTKHNLISGGSIENAEEEDGD